MGSEGNVKQATADAWSDSEFAGQLPLESQPHGPITGK